jgi:hypothetical protein
MNGIRQFSRLTIFVAEPLAAINIMKKNEHLVEEEG